jgi:hypothetical protein
MNDEQREMPAGISPASHGVITLARNLLIFKPILLYTTSLTHEHTADVSVSMTHTLQWTDFSVIIAPGVKLPKAPLELHPLSWHWNMTMPTHLTVTASDGNADEVESWLRSLPIILSVERASKRCMVVIEKADRPADTLAD